MELVLGPITLENCQSLFSLSSIDRHCPKQEGPAYAGPSLPGLKTRPTTNDVALRHTHSYSRNSRTYNRTPSAP